MKTDVMFSSEREDWETPQDLFDKLDKMFAFELDVCASAKNTKCQKFNTKEQNSLALPWAGRNWMNPPYGRAIGEFCRKADEVGRGGGAYCCFAPSSHRHEVVS